MTTNKSPKSKTASAKENKIEKLLSSQSEKIESLEKQLKTQNSRFVNMMEKIESIQKEKGVITSLLEEILFTLSEQQKEQYPNIDSNSIDLKELLQNKWPFDVN